MEVMTGDSAAQECFKASSIAARIHYTSSKDLQNCTYALDRSAMSIRDRAATIGNRGIIYMALGEYDKAIEDFNTALKLHPEFLEVHVNIGNVYFIDKEFNKALVEYTVAIDSQSSMVHVAHINRGMTYENMGDFTNAEKDYLEAQTLMPESALPQLRLEQLARKRAEQKQ